MNINKNRISTDKTHHLPDFTVTSYQTLLEAFIKKEYIFLGLVDFITQKSNKSIFLRHDVDHYTDRIEKFAKLEKTLGIKSTFYFRPPKTPQHHKTIETIIKNGHDIGYHYNDLAENKGNFSLAKESFLKTLGGFRSLGEVKSVCMHGNVFSSINNLDFWKTARFMDFGLTGDPYLLIDHQKTLYLTDTGRTWNRPRFSKWDKVNSPLSYHPASIGNIISDIENDSLPTTQLHLCIHPQHYHSNFVKWTGYYLSQSLKNQIKALLIR